MMFAKDYRHFAWKALTGNWGTMIVIFLIYAAIVAVCGVVPAVGTIALLLLSGPLAIGMYGAALKVVRGEKPEIINLFDGFQNFVNAFMLGLVNSIFIMLWSLLFFIPGIIKALSYSMSYYILIDNPEMSQSEARTASMVMMEGHKWRLFCLELSFIGWGFLCALTGGILTLWVAPYMQTAFAAFYEDLKAKQAPPVVEQPFAEAVPETITEQ